MPYIGNQPYQGVIDSGNIVDGSIQTGDLANSAVTTAKIADSNITSAKIADTGVTVAKLNSDVTQLIAQGGGPKITGVAITNSSWTTLDDTAVDTAGGYVKLTGTNFVTGCSVVVGTTSATAVTFTSSTELRVQLPAQAAGTYILYVTNPDGGTAIRVNAVTYSATPSWVTSSTLPQQDDGVAISIQLSATSATTYALQAGSTLPSGLTLSSGGLLSGTVSGLASDTSYSFTVVATDAELQDSPRAFTVTISASDPYFNLTTLLINGDTAPNVLTDASSNNFSLTAYGDARASNFTPYGTGWSNYFDGTGDYLNTPAGSVPSSLAQWYNTNYTIEMWVYPLAFTQGSNGGSTAYSEIASGGSEWWSFGPISAGTVRWYYYNGSVATLTTTSTISLNTWTHLAFVNNSSTLTIYINGIVSATGTIQGTPSNGTNQANAYVAIGRGANDVHFNGYISNLRAVRGTALYTAAFTPPTAPLTAITNTSLLTCHTNRFADGSANNFAITRNGDVAVRSFNPFNITNTDVDGSMYFDGSGDYVQANGANLAVGTGDFTFECWIYTWVLTGDPGIMQIGPSAYATNTPGYTNSIGMSITTGNVFFYNNGTYTTGNVSIQAYTWNHLAVCRSGTTHRLFVNGVQAASVADSSNYTGQFFGAGVGYGTNFPFTGYITNIRLLRGTALYTTAFTPSTIPLTAVANTQLLTLQYKQPHNNHGFQDSSTNNHLITRNGNVTQGTFSPFSPAGWSGYFNGSSVARVNTDAGLNILSYSALECWVNLSSLGSNSLLCGRESNFWFGHNYTALGGTANKFLFSIYNGSSWTTVSSSTSPLANTWYHILGIRDGTTMRFYLNGVQENTTTFSTTPNNGSAPFWMGGNGGSGSVTESFTGYLSNIRFITGATNSVAPYVETNSGNSFTPLTTNLSSVTGTQLLICQTNRFVDSNTVTTAKGIGTFIGAPSIQVYSPFKPTAAYSPITHGGSLYLDGTGDNLQIADTPNIRPGSGDFTYEFWWYPTSLAATYQEVVTKGTGLQIYTNLSTMYFGVSANNTGTYFINSSFGTLTANAWNHIVICRQANNYYAYLNGLKTTFSSSSSSPDTGTDIMYIGRYSSPEYPTIGYISNFRFVKGTAIYTAASIPTLPTSPVTATTDTQLLLNFTDAAARDSTGRLVLETVGDSKVSTVQKKYGTGAMYFDGTGDSLITPASIVNSIGTGDFTIEFWCYPSNTTAAYRAIVASENYNSTAGGWSIYQNGTGIEIYLTGGALVTAASQLVASTWQYIALVRSGSASNNCKLYVNGTNVASATNTADWTGQRIFIGDNNYAGTDYFFNGYIDDLRITKGYARYTTNFTPPAQTFKLR